MSRYEHLRLSSIEEQLDDIAMRQHQESLDKLTQAERATKGFEDPAVIADLGLAQAIYARRANDVRPYLAERGLVNNF